MDSHGWNMKDGRELAGTQRRRFCLEESTGLRPVMISKRRTPNAKTSVFSSTIPCMKYSGAKYPNVPSIGSTAWWLHLFGSHFASPKSVIYRADRNHDWAINGRGEIIIRNWNIRYPYCKFWLFVGNGGLFLHLWFIIWAKEDIWGLYVTMYDSVLTTFMKIMQAPCHTNCNPVSNWPLKPPACSSCYCSNIWWEWITQLAWIDKRSWWSSLPCNADARFPFWERLKIR